MQLDGRNRCAKLEVHLQKIFPVGDWPATRGDPAAPRGVRTRDPPPAFGVVTIVITPEDGSTIVDTMLADLSAADVNEAPELRSAALLDAFVTTVAFKPPASTSASETRALTT